MLTNDTINNLRTIGFSQEDFQIMSEILLKADSNTAKPEPPEINQAPQPHLTPARPASRLASNRNSVTATQKN